MECLKGWRQPEEGELMIGSSDPRTWPSMQCISQRIKICTPSYTTQWTATNMRAKDKKLHRELQYTIGSPIAVNLWEILDWTRKVTSRTRELREKSSFGKGCIGDQSQRPDNVSRGGQLRNSPQEEAVAKTHAGWEKEQEWLSWTAQVWMTLNFLNHRTTMTRTFENRRTVARLNRESVETLERQRLWLFLFPQGISSQLCQSPCSVVWLFPEECGNGRALAGLEKRSYWKKIEHLPPKFQREKLDRS